LVIAEVRDSVFAGAFNDWRLRVVAGTPTAGATLDNRNGAATLPNNSVLLADVLVAAANSSITDAEIRDRRPFGMPGVVPPLLTNIDMVKLLAGPGTPVLEAASIDHTSHDTKQSAVLMYLPRRIALATRIRWRYLHDSTALTGNYNIGIYDASGRLLVSTGSLAFTGAADTVQVRSETITATTFEAGHYYVVIGLDSSAVGTVHTPGIQLRISTVANAAGANGPNQMLFSASGGTTLPTTILSMTDLGATTSGLDSPSVPLIALSVG
jgi:hypothetical protein